MSELSYSSLSAVGKSYGETNHCTVIMTALILKTTYEDAWNFCAKLGRKMRKGFYTDQILKAAQEERGITYTKVYSRHRLQGYSGRACGYSQPTLAEGYARLRNVSTVNDLDRALPRIGTYVAITTSHVLTVVNGKVEDWSEGRRHRVISIYRIDGEPINQNPSVIMPLGMRRFQEEHKDKPIAPIKLRQDKNNWKLVRKDTGETIKYYKRFPNKIVMGITKGSLRLVTAPHVPLLLVSMKNPREYYGPAGVTL